MKYFWPFEDAENTAVFTTKSIAGGAGWIRYVSHDAEDGAWQFHSCAPPPSIDESAVVSLKSIVDRDRSILSLADLPLGWNAWRTSNSSPWTRERTEG